MTMKKTYIVCILLAVLVVAAGAGVFVLTGNALDAAEDAHEAVYEQYSRMQRNAAATNLQVTENGVIVGSYTLDQLGLLTDT